MKKLLTAFLSVGATATTAQESFVAAVEAVLRDAGIEPKTVGRNTFSTDAPLKAVTQLLDRCDGTLVLALERKFFPTGSEKRGGPRQTDLVNVKLPTPWNQIEAALAYSRGHPLMVVVEEGLTAEGLLERGNDWYVQTVELIDESLRTEEFKGVLEEWREKMLHNAARRTR